MKAVILAAGIGRRLHSLTKNIPKVLLPLKNGKTILDFQIESLTEVVSIDNIFIVVGYKKEQIMDKFPNLLYVYNNKYDKTNTGKSLLQALKKIDDDVLWLNGDIYFDNKILEKIISSKTSASIVDSKACGEEEVKYDTDDNGNIKHISKQLKTPLGEALGINLIKEKDLKCFINHLERIDDNDYFEKAIESMINEDNVVVKPINIGSFFCREIDFKEDLEEVREHLNKKSKDD